MTSTGVKPMKKKIEAALKMGQPQNQSQVWSILRLRSIEYYSPEGRMDREAYKII